MSKDLQLALDRVNSKRAMKFTQKSRERVYCDQVLQNVFKEFQHIFAAASYMKIDNRHEWFEQVLALRIDGFLNVDQYVVNDSLKYKAKSKADIFARKLFNEFLLHPNDNPFAVDLGMPQEDVLLDSPKQEVKQSPKNHAMEYENCKAQRCLEPLFNSLYLDIFDKTLQNFIDNAPEFSNKAIQEMEYPYTTINKMLQVYTEKYIESEPSLDEVQKDDILIFSRKHGVRYVYAKNRCNFSLAQELQARAII